MNKIKDCLVIVHASDAFLRKQAYDANILKKLIKARAEKYICAGLPVYYTPYLFTDPLVPSYLPQNKIIVIQDQNIERIPIKQLLNFQSFILKKEFMKKGIKSVELGGVQDLACVRGTHKALAEPDQMAIQSFLEYSDSDKSKLIFAVGRKVQIIVNNEITNSIFR